MGGGVAPPRINWRQLRPQSPPARLFSAKAIDCSREADTAAFSMPLACRRSDPAWKAIDLFQQLWKQGGSIESGCRDWRAVTHWGRHAWRPCYPGDDVTRCRAGGVTRCVLVQCNGRCEGVMRGVPVTQAMTRCCIGGVTRCVFLEQWTLLFYHWRRRT